MYNLYTGIIELTRQCNAKCRHCIIDAGEPKYNELSVEQIIKLLEDMSDAGCKFVVFTGGEALLRKEWPLFVQKARALDMQIVMMTNGLLINDSTIKTLKMFNVSLGISLDGAKAQTHDYIRGVNGIFDNFTKIIPKLNEAGIYVSVPTTVMQTNYNELDDIRDLLIDLKVPSWQIQIVKESPRMPDSELLTEEQYYKLAEKIVEYRKKYSDKINITEADCIGYNSLLTPDMGIKDWSGCTCGINTVCIESDGNVKGCPNMHNSEGNIQQRPFKEIWYDHNSFKYNRCPSVEHLTGFCQECEHKYVCRGGCPINPKSPKTNSAFCLHKIEQKGCD